VRSVTRETTITTTDTCDRCGVTAIIRNSNNQISNIEVTVSHPEGWHVIHVDDRDGNFRAYELCILCSEALNGLLNEELIIGVK